MGVFYAMLSAIILSVTAADTAPYSAIEKAFEENDAKALSGMGKSKFLIDVMGKEGVYSQSQATLVLKSFFEKHPGNQFDFVFKGEESSDGSFAIGNYTSKNQKFRVTIHFKKEGSNHKMESLRIENG